MDIALETIGLTKIFDRRAAVDSVNLSIPKGTIYGIVGANGAGKSTLLRLLHGVLSPDAGQIKVFGTTMPKESAEMRQRIQHVAAEGRMYTSFRVGDLVSFASGVYENWDQTRCQSLLAALELPEKRLIKHLSFGMQMQLRLVIRLSAHPEVLLLDEPTIGLDAVVKRQFLQLIIDDAIHDGTTVVMATHQLADLERMADGLAVMYQGRIIANGMLENLKQQVQSYQAILPEGLPHTLQTVDSILHTEQRGSLWTIIVEDSNGQIVNKLRQVSSHVESISLSLEEIFTYLLSKEGYSREAILLA